ncbi:MAG TPA: thioredoxin [Pyrinomonadaceae bacterium]|jgi:thioredoxin|nr:thioredoxin [Pyrinomonadaceae bacterium]
MIVGDVRGEGDDEVAMIITCAECGTKNRVDEKAGASKRAVCGKCGAELVLSGGVVDETGERPRVVTDETFAREVLQAGGRPVLLDCWAEWCGPCRMLAPVLDQLASESKGQYIIAKLNVDENPQTAAQFGIRSIPTMLIFKNGALVDRLVGVQPKQAIAARLASAG